MCGRYASTRSAADLAELFSAQDLTDGDLVPDYNVAPTDPAPIVRMSGRLRSPVLCVARWGFGTTGRMINARAETVASSRAYGDAFARRRCLVPADGWYEWRRDDGGVRRRGRSAPRAFFMTRPGGVVFGGIWSVWGAGTDARAAFSIVTLPALGELASVHDRMPLVLDESRWRDWLGESSSPGKLLTPPSSSYCAGIEIRPVSSAVGHVRKNGPELLLRVVHPEQDLSTVDQSPTLF